MMGRTATMRASASASAMLCASMRYAATTVAERLRPPRQCTSTPLVRFASSAAWMNVATPSNMCDRLLVARSATFTWRYSMPSFSKNG